MSNRLLKEKLVEKGLYFTALVSLLALAGIVIFLFMEGMPLFAHYSLGEFFFGDLWYPAEDPGVFGILPLITGSLAVTRLSS